MADAVREGSHTLACIADFDTQALQLGLFLAFVGVMSIWGFLAMLRDKRAAERGAWRISEATLLLIALCGGAIGVRIGQRAFRHKTRKQPFATYLTLCFIVNMLAMPAFLAVISFGWAMHIRAC
ncbi:MAG: hypothetical protein CSA72_11465 [Rhodobacterales bacterium]|nr:MAG: hypothetical protein CSA72_11465 [Rhodobacterales bacterium]